MNDWVKNNFPIVCEPSDITQELGMKFACYLSKNDLPDAKLCFIRCSSRATAVVLQVYTSCPPRSPIKFKEFEDIAVVFVDNAPPAVFSLRSDFPDTPHQAQTPAGDPFSICIDDRPWEEAKSTYTPAVLLKKILWWFEKSSLGDLQEVNQPVEPYFSVEALPELIVPRRLFSDSANEHWLALQLEGQIFEVKALRDVAENDYSRVNIPITVFLYDLSEKTMGRLRQYPSTLGEFEELLRGSGINFEDSFICHVKKLSLDESRGRLCRLISRVAFVLRIPIVHPVSKTVEDVTTRAFISNSTLADMAIKLDIIAKKEGHFPAVVNGNVIFSKVAKEGLCPCIVYEDFDVHTSTRLSGRGQFSYPKIVLVGCGSVGSHFSEALTREGVSDLTLVDHDTLLPHNLARHTLGRRSIAKNKAEQLSTHLLEIRQDLLVSAFNVRLDNNEVVPEVLKNNLESADFIIDASASVGTSRFISDLACRARKASIFFNPSGTSAVFMLEGREKTFDLRYLESVYYKEIIANKCLSDHLYVAGNRMVAYSGSCRDNTNMMPESSVMCLSGLIFHIFKIASQSEKPTINIWSMQSDNSIAHVSPDIHNPLIASFEKDNTQWQVRCSSSIKDCLFKQRIAHFPLETGGILLGTCDNDAKKIEILFALEAPIDSAATQDAFTRGVQRIRPQIERAQQKTLGQVDYIGEWHSHPGLTTPSATDIEQGRCLAKAFGEDERPGVMLIVGDHELSCNLIGQPAINQDTITWKMGSI